MDTAKIGYNKPLFVLPFDHRGSFQEKLFGIKGRQPTPEETKVIASYKEIVYNGFKLALKKGVDKNKAGILVDEQFGADILADAAKNGFVTACPAEKSGQDEFDFEYAEEFGAHIHKMNPSLVKVLVRYNTEGDAVSNQRQAARLKRLSDYCHKEGRKFMFELLVPATAEQLAKAGGNVQKYDVEQRPQLMIKAMQALQQAGVEADVWKLEGIDSIDDCKKVAAQAKVGGRKDVGVIILGRGENAEKVSVWLKAAKNVDGFIGFAVGRTIFWEPLKAVKEGKITREQAAEQIATNYKQYCDLWTNG